MKSFDVLSRDLNVFAPHFLEASAGTGKTFAIEHLVTRLVIEGASPIPIEQILVVTFTRAATRELKMRIRRNLLRTRRELEEATPTADYLRAICERGSEAMDSALKRIEGALVYYDCAHIFTLHGFCYRALREGAIEAGMGLSLPDPDQSDIYSLFAPLVKEHLCKKVHLPDYSPVQMRLLLKRYRGDHRKMITALVGKMCATNEIAPFPSFGALHASVVEALNSFEPIDCEKWVLDLALILPQYKGMTDKHFPAQIQRIGEILQKRTCTVEEFEQLCSTSLFLEKVSSDNVKARPPACPEEHLHYPGLLERVKEVFLRPLNIAKDPSVIFLRIARDLQQVLLPLIEEKEILSPDALLQKTAKALSSESFVAKMRKKYRAVIVDEFQDTDPLQWKIIQELFLGSVQAICLVGDPKQSIYSFRNADVYTYLDAARHLGEDAKGHLDTNFRSEEALVKALNLFFSQAKNGWMPLPALGKMLEVPAVKFRPAVEPSTEAALHFFIASGSTGRSRKFPHTELEEKKIYPYIASEIVRLHKEKGLELHAIALLVKDRYQAKSVIDHLKKWQIPAHFKRGSAITDAPAFFSLKLLLDSALLPSDTGKLKAVLGSPLIGWSAAELSGSPSEPPLLFAKMQIHHLHHLLVDRGFGTFFQAFLHTAFVEGGKCVLDGMLQQREIALYSDLRKLAELLIEEELASQSTPAQLLRFLEDLLWNHNEDEGRLRAVAQEERGSVVVMTTHLSKGLEFDTVFALGVIARHRTFDETVVKLGDAAVLTRFDPLDPECIRAREELDAEKMRQLYVCLTRAKKRLYVPLAIDEDQKEIPHAESSALEHFFTLAGWTPIDVSTATHHLSSLAPLISYSIAEEKEPVVVEEEQVEIASIKTTPLLLGRSEERTYSFSGLAHSHGTSFEDTSSPQENSPHALPLGSGTGQILHQIFENIFQEGAHSSLNEKRFFSIIDQAIHHTPLEPFRALLLPWIQELLTLPIAGFSLSQIAPEKLQQEMEFHFPLEHSLKGIMKGFADLFFEYNGKYYLLDWKSNYLGASDADYTQEKLTLAMQENDYFLQAAIYKDALARYVKLFDKRPFEEIFGGAIYYFIRGKTFLLFNPAQLKELI